MNNGHNSTAIIRLFFSLAQTARPWKKTKEQNFRTESHRARIMGSNSALALFVLYTPTPTVPLHLSLSLSLSVSLSPSEFLWRTRWSKKGLGEVDGVGGGRVEILFWFSQLISPGADLLPWRMEWCLQVHKICMLLLAQLYFIFFSRKRICRKI